VLLRTGDEYLDWKKVWILGYS